MKLKHHTFRPVTDGIFMQPDVMDYIRSATFADHFKKKGLRLLIGEMQDEDSLYGATNSPQPNLESLRLQISNYYASTTTDRLLQHYSTPNTSEQTTWTKLFGKILADGQVRAPSRLLVNSLHQHGVSNRDIWRYCISYRLSFITAEVAPVSFGVTHGMDKPIWK